MSLDIQREETVQLLCRQFALDHLTTQELESRLERVYRAASAEELRALVAGLPPVPLGAHESRALATASHSGVESGARRLLAIFGSVKKRGDWEPAQHMEAKVLFGELELDFRDALIHEGVTTVEVHAAFADVRVIVPAGLHVECDGSAVFGEFSEKSGLSAAPGSGAPTLRITGGVVFGQVEVSMRLPGESASEARKRERRK